MPRKPKRVVCLRWDFEVDAQEKTGRFPFFMLEGGGEIRDEASWY